MAAYRYQALDASGRRISGMEEAATAEEAMSALEIRKLFVTRIEEAGRAGEVSLKSRILFFLPPASSMDLVLFYRRLATLVASDIPLLESLSAIHGQTEKPEFRAVLNDIKERVRGGASFSEALNRHPRVFPELMVSMVRVGETGGILAPVLEELADFTERDNEIRNEVRTALAYPVLVFLLALGTVVFLLLKVVPRISILFEGMNAALPIPTRVLMAASDVVTGYGVYILIGLVAAGIGVYKYSKSNSGKERLDGLKLYMPVIGPLLRKAAIARFSRSLGAILHGGVPLMEGLIVVDRVIGYVPLSQAVERIMDSVRKGDSLARGIQRESLFPEMVKYMVSAGEDSGQLPEMLLKIAGIYEMETRQAIKMVINLVAPILILAVAAVVGFIAFAMLLPIFQINQMIG